MRDTSSLKDLGVDSLAAVELAEGLERTFGVTPPDVDVAEWLTVGDVVRTVTRRQAIEETRENAGLIPVPATIDDPDQTTAFKRVAVFVAVLAAAVGVGLGVVLAMMLTTTGIGPRVGMPVREGPPIPVPVTQERDTARPPSERTTEPKAEARLSASPDAVAPGQRFALEGQLPNATVGERLQIQMRSNGGAWEDFPVTVTANDGGAFKTELYTSRVGTHEFQVKSGRAQTPPAKVTIGR